MSLEVGARLGDLTVVAGIGEGSHAAIYKVRHDDGSRAALKVLHTVEPVAKERLLREGRALGTLHHPNVVQLYRAMEVDDRPALLMELVAGPTLGDWMDTGGAPSVEEALDVFRGIARGVQAVHSVGLVHRDLNPGNIILAISSAKRVVPKLVDFGLVQVPGQPGITRPGAMGTPAYMAPEQITDGHSATARSDIFSLGCILYELLCHERAFQGADILELYKAATDESFMPVTTVRPDVDEHVASVVHRMLAADPDARFQRVEDVLETLFLDDVPLITDDERPEVFAAWSEVRLSTARAAQAREMVPAATISAPARLQLPPGASMVPALVAGLVGLTMGLGLAWWVLG
jgi:eukaryotic-like serine/threonine-protein kinase